MSETMTRKLKPGEIIFREGDAGDCAYLIEKGSVSCYIEKDGTEIPLRTLGAGEVIGEMALIDGSPRSATCRASDDVHLLLVTKTQLIDRITAADPVVRLLMQALLDRLRSQNQRLRGVATSEKTSLDLLATEKKAALARIELENRIAAALDTDEFGPFYQPIYDLETGEVAGCEALMRWIGSDGKVIPPSEFMYAMEDSPLILRAGHMMLVKSARDLPIMQRQFGAGDRFFVSVNVSGRQFMHPDFIRDLEAIRKAAKVDAANIKLELTERIMTEGTVAIAALKNCRALGYQLAIDDFGTGFSSLQYLAQMPITHLKIDRSFVMNLFTDAKSLLVVKSLIHMAGILSMELIAEGIETKEQLDLLRQLGVGHAQGFLFSKPIPLSAFLKLAPRLSA